jgi:DNA-binding NarL/FixJ family response regulator
MALFSDAASSLPIDLALLWHDLRAGAARVDEMFHEHDLSYFVLSRQPRAKSITDLNSQRLDIFERTLAGQSPRHIAHELSISPAQISAAVRDALKTVGLTCAPSSIPLPLKLAYRAATLRRSVSGRLSHFHWQGITYDIVSVQRVELTLAERLDDAERALLRLIFEGYSVERIASRNGASVRTTAGQVSDVLHELGVATRSELAELALSHALRDDSP